MKRFFSVLAITGAMVVGASSLKGAWIEGGNPLPVAFSNMVIFDSAGTYTWTVPDGVYKIKVEMWGAGGGGAYYDGSSFDKYCGGGGGGYGLVVIDVTPGQVCAITVGAGGDVGEEGGDTYVVCGSANYISYGGGGASISTSYPYCDPGDGGTATTPFFLKGEDGGWYYLSTGDESEGFAHGGSSPRGGFGGFWDNSSPYDSWYGSWPGGGGFSSYSGADGAVIIWY